MTRVELAGQIELETLGYARDECWIDRGARTPPCRWVQQDQLVDHILELTQVALPSLPPKQCQCFVGEDGRLDALLIRKPSRQTSDQGEKVFATFPERRYSQL